MKNYRNKLFIIILILIIINILYPTYYFLLPSIPIYPNNYQEVKIVKNWIDNRTQKDIDFFYKTNKSISPAFLPYVEESLEELNFLIQKPLLIIGLFKYSINRARPKQIDSSISPINISTAQTPAFPAGHAFQAYYLAKILSKKYPSLKNKFYKIAKECDLTRVKAGLHYPSDGEFSKFLVDLIYK